jgi:hypothetical protein
MGIARAADVAFIAGAVLVAGGGAIVIFAPTTRTIGVSGKFQ